MTLELWFHKLYVTIVTYIPFHTLGLCAFIALALLCFFFFLHAVIKKSADFKIVRFASLSCFISWLYFIAEITLLSRLSFENPDFGLNLQLFTQNPEGMFSTVITALYNALMFAPLAFLLPFMAKIFKKFYITLPLCIILAAAVEYLQFYLKLGMCELDDFIYYTAGLTAGFIIHFPIAKLIDKTLLKP